MCQGQQARLKGVIDYPKHFTQIAGEPLVERTLRQLAGRHCVIVAKATDHHWADLKRRTNVPIVELRKPGDCILDGLWHARSTWRRFSKVTVVLGDVVFSERAIAAIAGERETTTFYATPELSAGTGEVFAMSFRDKVEMTYALDTAPCRDVHPAAYQPGHMRNLLWHMRASRMQTSVVEISDYTKDIDTAEDLCRIPSLEAAMRGGR